jgi:hypothetical protein
MGKLTVQVVDESGPITLKNYGQRAQLHASRRRKAGFVDDFPVASKAPDGRDLLVTWEAYFRLHLGGYPYVFSEVLNDKREGFTLPDARPEAFDISWEPRGFNPAITQQAAE